MTARSTHWLAFLLAVEEDQKQASAQQRGHSEKGLWSKIASAFNCEPTDLHFDMHLPPLRLGENRQGDIHTDVEEAV